MPIEFQYDEENRVIITKGTGVVSMDELIVYGRNVLNLDGDLKGAVEYVDLSQATDVELTYLSAKSMLSTYRKWMERGVKGSVFYVPSDLSYGLVCMIRAVLGAVIGQQAPPPITTRDYIEPAQVHDIANSK